MTCLKGREDPDRANSNIRRHVTYHALDQRAGAAPAIELGYHLFELRSRSVEVTAINLIGPQMVREQRSEIWKLEAVFWVCSKWIQQLNRPIADTFTRTIERCANLTIRLCTMSSL